MPRLSLCMIVKNEAEHLPDFLSHIAPLIDEYIIVDTGSTDATPDIIQHVAPLRTFTWCDDFSAARNDSLARATGDWILVLDADERLDSADFPRIRALVDGDPTQFYSLRQRTYTNQLDWYGVQRNPPGAPFTRGTLGYTDLAIVRLIPNNPALHLRYVQRIHEGIESADAMRQPIATDIVIHHYGYLRAAPRLQDKATLYAQLEALRVREQPDDAEGLRQYGAACLAQGDLTNARRAFADALALDADHPSGLFGAIITAMHQRDFAAAAKVLDVALTRWPDDIALQNLCGVWCLETGALQDAAAHFAEWCAKAPDHLALWYNRGRCAIAQQDLELASQCFARVLVLNPSHADALYNAALVADARNDHSTARLLLTCLLELHPNDQQAQAKLAQWVNRDGTT